MLLVDTWLHLHIGDKTKFSTWTFWLFLVLQNTLTNSTNHELLRSPKSSSVIFHSQLSSMITSMCCPEVPTQHSTLLTNTYKSNYSSIFFDKGITNKIQQKNSLS